MPTTSAQPPRNTDRAALATLRELLAKGHTDEVLKLIGQLLARNAELELKLAGQRAAFKTHEGVSTEQLRLLLDSLPVSSDEARAVADAILLAITKPPEPEPTTPKPPKTPRVRKPFPPELPRVENKLDVPAEDRPCPLCGGERVCIGHEATEVLDFIPAKVFVRLDLRELLACRPCDAAPERGPLGDKVVRGGKLGSGLVAQLLVDKYRDGLPLTRQRERFLRIGVDLSTSTLADQVRWAAECLQPLHEALLQQVLAAEVMQLDATGLDVLEKSEAGIKLGSMWAYVGRIDGLLRVACLYCSTGRKNGQREGERGPEEILALRTGFTLADAAGLFDASFRREGIIECGCNAHARRYFVRALDAKDDRAALPLAAFKRLYDIEEEVRGREPAAVLAAREKGSVAVYDELAAWVAAHRPHEPPTSLLGKALQYFENHVIALRQFLGDGRIPIDNNDTERVQIRTALTRKNFLFAGSDAGAERAAIVYSLIGSCVAAGVEPVAYLRDVLPRLARSVRVKDVPELLPLAWKKRQAAAAAVEAPDGAVELPAAES